MARSHRVSAIRGYRAATGDQLGSQPTPFRGGDVSTGAILAKVGLGLIARRRAQSAMAEMDREARLQEEYTRAQIANLNSLSASRTAVEPTMDLEIPGRDMGTEVGPSQPEVIRGLKPNEYATQRRLYFPPPPTVNPETERHNRAMEGLRERGLGIARDRLEKGQADRDRHAAAQSELSNITADEVRRESEIKNVAASEALIYKQRAAEGQPDDVRKQAIAALGADPGKASELSGDSFNRFIDAWANDYVKRRTANAMWRVREKNKGRREAAEAVTKEAAGLGITPEQQFLQDFKGIINTPDDDEE